MTTEQFHNLHERTFFSCISFWINCISIEYQIEISFKLMHKFEAELMHWEWHHFQEIQMHKLSTQLTKTTNSMHFLMHENVRKFKIDIKNNIKESRNIDILQCEVHFPICAMHVVHWENRNENTFLFVFLFCLLNF